MSEFTSGFMFGCLVTQGANDLPRDPKGVAPNIRQCLEDVVAGNLTLVESPEEISPGIIPDMPAEYAGLKEQMERDLRQSLNAVRQVHRQYAAYLLAEIAALPQE